MSRLWWWFMAFSQDGVSEDAGEAARGVECEGVPAGLDAAAGWKEVLGCGFQSLSVAAGVSSHGLPFIV